jgi:hypothetical protein
MQQASLRHPMWAAHDELCIARACSLSSWARRKAGGRRAATRRAATRRAGA